MTGSTNNRAASDKSMQMDHNSTKCAQRGQVNLARTWFMYLLWPFTAGTHQPSDLISGQATPTIDDTYGSIVSASPERSSRFRTDMRCFRCLGWTIHARRC
ncbi:hypothetical protein BDR07DRAFT_463681 [Suillus spraguei]|nr:hypothetical protein BDR07DRAFT_463681 [Suillus spraguei]